MLPISISQPYIRPSFWPGAMRDPSLRQLRTFLAVAETGSVSGAARSLNVTQPAASQQLRELERAFGVRLLDRAAGKMTPTAAGHALLGPARRAQGAIEDALGAMAAHRAGDSGRVRLGTGATACIHLLPPVLTAVKQLMPGLEIVIVTGNTPAMLHQLEAGNLDLALVTLPSRLSPSLTAMRLRADPLIAVVPSKAASSRIVAGPVQLARLPLILYETEGNTRGIVDAWFQRAGLRPQPIMELGNVEAIKVLVASGLGASILPQLALQQPMPGTALLPLRPSVQRQLGIVLRREKVVDRGLRVLLTELERVRQPRGADATAGSTGA
jgi:DNA-binding transcriptional LysR family regulator